jgi:hypothetical protein
MRAEGLKANLGTGGKYHVGWRSRMTLQNKGTSNTTAGFASYEDWIRGKADDVTQGDLIVSA